MGVDGSMYPPLGTALKTIGIILAVLVPLGIWKLGEIVWWLITHVHIG